MKLHTIFIEQKGEKMRVCKGCKSELTEGNILACKNCGSEFCSHCAENTMRICPYCYTDMEFIG